MHPKGNNKQVLHATLHVSARTAYRFCHIPTYPVEALAIHRVDEISVSLGLLRDHLGLEFDFPK